MSNQNEQNNHNSQENKYSQMSIDELRELASKKAVLSEQNEESKDALIEALKKSGQLGKSEPNTTEEKKRSSQKLGESGSKEAQEVIYDEILNKLETRGIDIDNVSVTFDGVKGLSYKNTNVKNRLTDEQANLLTSAVKDPANFKGSLTIKSGNKVLLKIKDSQVIKDTYGITGRAMKVKLESPADKLYKKYSQNAKGKGLSKTKQVAQNAIADGLDSEQTKEVIRQQDEGYKNHKKQNNPQVAETNLDLIVNQAIAHNIIQKQKHQKQQQQQQQQQQQEDLVQSR